MKLLRNFLTIGTIAIALTLTLGGCGISQSAGGPKDDAVALGISNRLAAIAAAGDPVTLEALDQLYVTPPAGENAAPLYEQAFAAIKNQDATSTKFVADNIMAVPLLEKAAERKACRYPVVLTDGAVAKLPHLTKFKQAVTLLQMVAVNQAAKKRPDAATTTLLAGLSLAHSLDKEPFVISKLVEIASLVSTLDGMAQSLSLQSFSDTQLQSLQEALKTFETGISLRQVMLGERTSIIHDFQMSEAEMAKVAKSLYLTNGVTDPAYRKTEKFQQDFAFALDYMSNLVALAEMPYAESLENLPKVMALFETASAQDFIISKILLPATDSSLTKSAQVAARIRAAQTALAVERYRLKHANGLPGALTDLVPDFIAAIPADPFDGQPLRFKSLPGKGYVVYSIGKNKVDDGGVEKSSDGKTKLDETFTVRR